VVTAREGDVRFVTSPTWSRARQAA
jgi:hypothetical protein